MKISTLLPATYLLLATTATAQSSDHIIWFDRPTSQAGTAVWFGGHPERFANGKAPVNAGDAMSNPDPEWERRSLPLGNGSIGANVMGSIATERLTLNEKTLWRGGPATGNDADKGSSRGATQYWSVNKSAASVLPKIRQAFANGDTDEAARLTQENYNSNVPYEATGEASFRFGSFTTMGELCIETGIDSATTSDYRRALSLDSAVATVSFSYGNAHYERTAFISYPDNVLVLRFRANRKGLQNLRLAYSPNPVSTGYFASDEKAGLCYIGHLDNNGMKYVVRIQAIANGGTVNVENNALRIKGADEVTFLLTADTDYAPNYDLDFSDPHAYVGVEPETTTAAWMKQAIRKGYASLLRRHYADYAALFNRVTLHIDGATSPAPTDCRLASYRAGTKDVGLETLYYQFGRYLLIASSRQGNLPANLQGIWHNNVDGPWRVDYHNNINLQMNYWPALSTNLAECAEPLTDFIRLLEKPGRVTAKSYWNARGWAASISANIFGFTAPLESQDMSWNYNPMAASWLTTHLWDYYDYTRDKDFLRRIAYPLIKGCAEFTQDYLWQRSDGIYTAAPSTSPEHGPIDEGTTFTHAVVRDILDDAIRAAHILDTDTAEAASWQRVLDKLAPYRIGRYGQLLEWSQDIDNPDDHHRHVNHLYGLHPGHSISPISTPDLAQAARVVLEHRGDGATGWSMGWKLNQWARLHDGNHSYLLYTNLLKNGTADNLWDLHPPFQIDGNFGGTAGVTEMLLQSHDGCINLLPALPDAWPTGSVKGLRTRGNFGVDITWRNGTLEEAVITSDSGETCIVRYGEKTVELSSKRGKTYAVRLINGQLTVKACK